MNEETRSTIATNAQLAVINSIHEQFDQGYAGYTCGQLSVEVARAYVNCMKKYHRLTEVLNKMDGFTRIHLVEEWSDIVENFPVEEGLDHILDAGEEDSTLRVAITWLRSDQYQELRDTMRFIANMHN